MSSQAESVRSFDPRTGAGSEPVAAVATPALIGELVAAAAAAFRAEQQARTFDDARLLHEIADRIDAIAPDLRDAAAAETGLPATPRLQGEIGRTTGQLRAFAAVVEAGEHLDLIIDTADAAATPPRPDQRRMAVPIGPVAVYAASNFPFAFSVAGGDTAAALAAGCPVVVKAHPGHPRTSELVAEQVRAAVAAVGAPAAWFSLIHGGGPDVGQALARAAAIEAIAFTGSFGAGTALARTAAERPRPIPVFAEMGSTNPFLVTPAAAAARGAAIAEGLAASVAGMAGQLCTKPGLVGLVDEPASRAMVAGLVERLAAHDAMPMLSPGLRDGFARAATNVVEDPRSSTLVPLVADDRPGAWQAPSLAEIPAAALASEDPLLEETFGPAALVIWCADEAELERLAADLLPAALTGTVHAEDGEPLAGRLVTAFARKVGRIVFDGYPTGVAVAYATVHGGPFPATTAPAHTSVGMTAARRFLRPVGYQAVPDALLPAALQDANPLGCVRRVDGTLTDAAVARPVG